MKKPIVSLITPTHRTDKLLRLYESIENQTCRQFEWIVVTNGSADVSILPKKKWIKIIPYTDSNLNIGALKNFSFMQGQGELLAEVLSTCVVAGNFSRHSSFTTGAKLIH